MGGLRRSWQHVHVCPRETLVPWIFPTVCSKTGLPTLFIVCGKTGLLTHFIEAVVIIPVVRQRLLHTVQTLQNSAKTPSLILLQVCGHPVQPLSLQVSLSTSRGSWVVSTLRTGLLKSQLNACHMWSFAFPLEVSPRCSVASSILDVSLRGFSYLKCIAALSLKFEIAPGLRPEVEGDGHGGLRLSAPWLISSRPAGTLYRFAVQVFSLRRLLWLLFLR